jgi:hypothetical protein
MHFIALGVAWTQRDPGPAVWDHGVERTWEGVLHVTPYPMLAIESGDDRGIALLVQQGKRGALDRCASGEPRRVRLRGWRLQRDDRRIIELAPEPNAIETLHIGGFAPMTLIAGAPITLTGEIVDSKCFLGAMKPGDGATHKACAMLCLRGGIPPMLVSRDLHGPTRYTLVLDERGGPMPPEFIPLAGEPVTVTGTLGMLGDLEVVLVGPADVRPGS